jgi:multidrug resistance protein
VSPTQRKNFLIILILGTLSTVSPFAIDMYLPAISQIAQDLSTTPAKVSMSISSYFIGLGAGQLFYRPMLDRFGRKPPLYVGLLLFILASIGCLESKSVDMLIAFRLLQALGGCVAQVDAIAMVRDFFPVEQSSRIISMLILILGVSPLLAPTVGSIIATTLGWHWIFLLLAIIAALAVSCWLFTDTCPTGINRIRRFPSGRSGSLPASWQSSRTGNFVPTHWRARFRSAACSSTSPVHRSFSWTCSTSARAYMAPSSRCYRSGSSAATRSTSGSRAGTRTASYFGSRFTANHWSRLHS